MDRLKATCFDLSRIIERKMTKSIYTCGGGRKLPSMPKKKKSQVCKRVRVGAGHEGRLISGKSQDLSSMGSLGL